MNTSMQLNFLGSLQQWFIEHAWHIFAILFVGWLGYHFGSRLISQIVHRTIRRSRFSHEDLTDDDIQKRQKTLISMLSALWKVAVLVVVVLTVLAEAKLFDMAPLFASAGIIGIALGFGAQSIIKDLLTGIFIITENQYRVGDVVDIEGAAGTVERITIRSTILRDADGNVHYMPNGNIAHVINKTMGFSKVNFSLAVDPDVDVDKLAEIINEVGDTLAKDPKWSEKIIEPPHFLSIGTFSDLSLEVKISGKTQPSAQWVVTGEIRKRLLAAFHKNKIELANLQMSPYAPPKKQ